MRMILKSEDPVYATSVGADRCVRPGQSKCDCRIFNEYNNYMMFSFIKKDLNKVCDILII